MSVKDVLQSLVDDNMVDCERVGTSNYYWAFPSKAVHARKLRIEELEKQVMPSHLPRLTQNSKEYDGCCSRITEKCVWRVGCVYNICISICVCVIRFVHV